MLLSDFNNIVINESSRPQVLMIIEEGQINEVNLKKMAAMLGLVGTLFTASNVEAYDNRDLMKMGFTSSEASQLMQMAPEQRANEINKTIQSMRQIDGMGAKKVYGGDTYLFPQTSADTVDTDKPINKGKFIGTRDDPQSTSYDRTSARSGDPFGMTPERGSGDPEKLKKNARLLYDIVRSDRSFNKYVSQVYYSSKLNKIVIIPAYPDIPYAAGSKVNQSLGQGVLDNIARKILIPKITQAIARKGVPGLDMDNVIIVDRTSRAPR